MEERRFACVRDDKFAKPMGEKLPCARQRHAGRWAMNLSTLVPAFLMGAAGGLHCAGMCGGIVVALSLGAGGAWKPSVILYHSGRLLGYSILGLFAGLLGGAISGAATVVPLAQAALSITAGVIMVFFALQLAGFLPERFAGLALLAPPTGYMKKAAGRESLMAFGVVGLWNGFLPCGLVYAALALAFSDASAWGGALTMIVFGLGTVPALLLVGVVTRAISPALRGRILQVAAMALVLYGVFMIAKPFIHTGHDHGHSHSHSHTGI